MGSSSMESISKLKMVAGHFYIPRHREDSFFIYDLKQTVGVADGVGSWRKRGIDAGKFANELTLNCLITLSCYTRTPDGGEVVDPKRLLQQAFAKSKLQGSSTACIVTLRDQTLHAANVGDSGFMVFRDSKMIYQSPIQQCTFNHPFQLGRDVNCQKPDDAQVFEVGVKAGDVLVMGTDGLLDNMFPRQIEKFIRNKGEQSPRELASVIANCASYNSKHERDTPFAQNAREAGISYKGGKLDDITVIVAFIN